MGAMGSTIRNPQRSEMTYTLVPDDLFDRQVAVTRNGVDGIVTIIDGQRSALAAAVQLPMLTFEALAHVTRSLISAAVEVTDRASTSSTESLDRIRESLALDNHREQARPVAPSGRGAAPTAA
jgi:hypothetical protein